MTPAEQAALPAVEEMAEKITRISYRHAQDGPYDKVPGEDLKDCQRKIAPLLTPLYAKLSKHAEVLGECRTFARNELSRRYSYYWELQREYANCKKTADHTSESAATSLRDARQLLARIDALLGVKGET